MRTIRIEITEEAVQEMANNSLTQEQLNAIMSYLENYYPSDIIEQAIEEAIA